MNVLSLRRYSLKVIGPIEQSDWNTMRLLRTSLEYLRGKHSSKFDKCIEMETNLYKEYKLKYLNEDNS